MKKLFLTVLSVVIILSVSCDTTESGRNGTIFTELSDASCTECWINVETTGISLPEELTLYRDNVVVQTLTLTESDTVLYDSLLSPSQTYKFKVKIAGSTTKEISVTTMDTTSHDFTWETFTFGEHSSSVLNDVAIIDENNIWAVGKIYVNDSTGAADPNAYNAVHWNGEEWERFKLQFYTICGQTNRSSYPASSIYVFDENNMWICMDGSQIIIMSGVEQVSTMCLPFSFSIKSIWGTSSSDLYAAGTNGNLAHYDGTNWTKLESSTELDIQDIWGSSDQTTGNKEVLCVASNRYYNEGSALLKIRDDDVEELNNDGLSWSLSGIWFIENKKYYISGNQLYEKNLQPEGGWRNTSLNVTNYYTYKIRGTSYNNIAAAGGYGEILHYNGKTWKSYHTETSLDGNYYSVDIKTNVIVAVGFNNSKAAITIGRK